MTGAHAGGIISGRRIPCHVVAAAPRSTALPSVHVREVSDESPRSAQGNAPQRRPTVAPTWWGELERDNLPDDEELTVTSAPLPRGARPPRLRGGTVAAPQPARTDWRERMRTVASALVLTAAFLVVAWFGVGGGSSRSMVVVTLVFGVPTLLAVIAVALVLRRER